jgi:hypothetical protein
MVSKSNLFMHHQTVRIKKRGFEVIARTLSLRLDHCVVQERDQGKRNEARELLAPVYGWFTDVLDTRDLKEAKAVLDD